MQGNVVKLQTRSIKCDEYNIYYIGDHEFMHMNSKQNHRIADHCMGLPRSVKWNKSFFRRRSPFFGKTEHVWNVQRSHLSCSLRSSTHTTIYLSESFREIRKTNRRKRVILHYDNHTSAQKTTFLITQHIASIVHSPYRNTPKMNKVFNEIRRP